MIPEASAIYAGLAAGGSAMSIYRVHSLCFLSLTTYSRRRRASNEAAP